jgi:hypothetical protein
MGAQTAGQFGAPARVAVQRDHRDDAIGPESAKALAQFAPGRQHSGSVHEGELDRPDHAAGVSSLFILVGDVEAHLAADCSAQFIDRGAVLRKCRCWAGQAQRRGDLRLRLRRQHGTDLCQRDGGGGPQHGVAALIDIAQPQQHRFDLVCRQHERRQEQARPQNVADARFAVDRRTLRHQIGDIAIDGPLRYLQLFSQPGGGNRAAAATQSLEQGKEAAGTGHGSTLI